MGLQNSFLLFRIMGHASNSDTYSVSKSVFLSLKLHSGQCCTSNQLYIIMPTGRQLKTIKIHRNDQTIIGCTACKINVRYYPQLGHLVDQLMQEQLAAAQGSDAAAAPVKPEQAGKVK